MSYAQPRKTRSLHRAKLRQSGEKQAGKKLREKMNRKRYARPFDVGRVMCYRGNRVVVMSQDFNEFPDKDLAVSVFAYLWQGINSWEYRWQRVQAFERMGKWILSMKGDYRLAN